VADMLFWFAIFRC